MTEHEMREIVAISASVREGDLAMEPIVHWEVIDAGPVHLHVDAAFKGLLLELRGKLTSGSLEMHEFDAACKLRGLEPWRW